MAAGRNRVLAACGAAVVVLIGIGSSAPVQADPFDGLIVASGPVALAGGDPASGSISVTNPTDQDIVVAAADQGTDAEQNRCEVTVTKATVASGTSATVPFSVASTDDCTDLTRAGISILLTATSEPAGSEPQLIELTTAAPAKPTKVETTGIEVPTDTVFLRRRGDDLVGTMSVSNTTAAAVIITPSTVEADCTVVPPAPPGDGIQIAPGGSEPVPIRLPDTCTDLDADAFDLTVLASSTDGTKYGYTTVPLQAEVPWDRVVFWVPWLVLATIAATVAAMFSALRSASLRNAAAGGAPVKAGDGLAMGKEAPKSWLTGFATFVPVITTLFSTTGLLDGLTGSTSTAPATLVLVSTALALALVAAATLVSNIAAVEVEVDGAKQYVPRIWHFATAAWLTGLAGVLSIAAVWGAATTVDLPGGDLWVHVVGSLLLVALVAYLARSVYWSVSRFAPPKPDPLAPPKQKEASPEVLAGAMVALASCYLDCTATGVPGDEARDAWLQAARAAATAAVNPPPPPPATVVVEQLRTATDAVTTARDSLPPADTDEGREAERRVEEALASAAAMTRDAEEAALAGDEADALRLAVRAAEEVDAAAAATQAVVEASDQVERLEEVDAAADAVQDLRSLTTSPGDELLSSDVQITAERRPLTRFMI